MIVVKINKLVYLRILLVVEYELGIEVTRILQTAAYSVLFVFVLALPKN